MRRPLLQRSLVLGATALTLLTACGSGGSTNGNTGTAAVVATDPADSIVPSTDPTGTDTVATDSVTTVKASGSGNGTSVDPSLDASIAEIEALLGKNDQDLKDAATAAANGG